MINLDSFPLLKSIGIAGIFATIVASWSTLKNVFSQLSAVIILQTRLDHTIHLHLIPYLKQGWKRLPSGISNYTGVWLEHFDKERRLTPFRTLNQTEVFYKGKRFILIKIGNGEATMYSVRWLFNPEKLISKALLWKNNELNKKVSSISNFRVIDKIGTAGNFFDMRNGSKLEVAQPADSQDNSYTGCLLDTTVDKSFLYKFESYNFNNQIDVFENFHYSPKIMEYIEEAKMWMNNKTWYQERSIPWRRGWLAYGPAGTGKSNLSSIVAKILNVRLYNMVLSTMTDQDFREAWRDLELPCVVLLDDFDTVFNGRENVTPHKALSFETVLQTISGVKSCDGVFLMITTNHIEKIDPAIGVDINDSGMSTRPGRIDRVIYMGPACDEVKSKLISKILVDWPHLHEEVLRQTTDYTVAQVIEKCREVAFEQMKLNQSH